MAWQRMSRRNSGVAPDEPYEGVPSHLRGPLIGWVSFYFCPTGNHYMVDDGRTLRQLATLFRVPIDHRASDGDVLSLVLQECNDETFLLDFIDAMLELVQRSRQYANRLRGILALGGSVWTVSDAADHLTRRIDAAATESVSLALTPRDAASAELSEAWQKAYGLHPDPSDAWDHAIKAVETVLKPIVVPNQQGATLGSVLGQLRGQPAQYQLTLIDNAVNNPVDSVVILEQMLHLIWPNSDRHGGGARTPSLEEAQGVVQLAVTIVQWARAGLIKKR